MMNTKIIFLIFFMVFSVVAISPAWSIEKKDNFSYQPVKKAGNKKWRIIYYQGGYSNNYFPYLQSTIRGLADLGWIKISEFPEMEEKDTKKLWDWLAKNITSEYIEFVVDGYYTADWDSSVRIEMKKAITKRLKNKKDIDLVIAMGTWAGLDMASNEHDTPIIVMSSTDPVGAGIIKSNMDSGYDHILARVDPDRWKRQIEIFHKLIGFRRLGIAYEDSAVGKSYAAIDLIEKIAKERGFNIVRCYTLNDIPDQDQAGASVIKCFEELVSKVDAIYVVIQNGVNYKTIPTLVKIANKNHIPTFSQQGSDEVRAGFLMSISRQGGFGPVGRFLAISIAKIFNGANPRQLNQVFEEGPAIAINLNTAETIGLYLNAEILAGADEIYREHESP